MNKDYKEQSKVGQEESNQIDIISKNINAADSAIGSINQSTDIETEQSIDIETVDVEKAKELYIKGANINNSDLQNADLDIESEESQDDNLDLENENSRDDNLNLENKNSKDDNLNLDNKKSGVNDLYIDHDHSTDSDSEEDDHKKRIRKMKKGIITFIFILIMIPYVLLIFMAIRQNQLNKSLDVLSNSLNQLKNEQISGNATVDFDAEENYSVSENDTIVDNISNNAISDSDDTEEVRNVCLTFDDGPSKNTDAILDILKEYDVKATFFVVGKSGYDDEYRRIVNEGHTLGMHSYCHVYSSIYQDLDSFQEDFTKIRDYLKDITGVTCEYYRFPGGSSNTVSNSDMTEFIQYLNEQGVIYIDWNISSEDAAGADTVEEIVSNVMTQIENCNADTLVILFHDSSDKEVTVEALPIIISDIQAMDGLRLVPINDDVTPVQHVVLEETVQ